MAMEKINLKTSDNVEIIGDYYPVENKEAPAVILLHMMPATKESWEDFAKKLNLAGFQCLAIDLRGHGESQGGPLEYTTFSDEQHRSCINDVEVAVNFFVSKNVSMNKILLMGASIGANLSLQFQVTHPQIKTSVLLSPGLDYVGIDSEPLVKKLENSQAVFFVAGGENDDYSTETALKLFEAAKVSNKKIKTFHNAGHGTTILKEELGFVDEIIGWLKKIYC